MSFPGFTHVDIQQFIAYANSLTNSQGTAASQTEYYSQKNKTIGILMATIKGETLVLLSENILPAFKIWKEIKCRTLLEVLTN